MTDKIQKIREEVVRMHNLLPIMDGDNISVNYADRICTTLEMYIDSLQEEPKKCMYSKDDYTDEDRNVLCDGCEEECRFNKKEDSVNDSFDLGCGVIWKEEPVSDGLIEELKKIVNIRECVSQGVPVIKIAKHFAQWQKEQLLAKAFDAYCKVCGHYAHTTPTYICRHACDYFKDFEQAMKNETQNL